MMKCPNCGNETQSDAVFCDQCGTRLPHDAVPVVAPDASAASSESASIDGQCPACGATNTPGEMFCSECGTPLAAPEPEPLAEAPEPDVTASPPVASEAVAEPAAVSPTETGCPTCGAKVPTGDRFCFACGAELAETTSSPQQASGETATSEPADDIAAQQPTAVASEAQASPEAAPPAPTECPACGAQVNPGDAFCEFCGAALISVEPAAAPEPATQDVPTPTAPPAASVSTARFVVSESGVEIPLPDKAEVLIGREDPVTGVYPDIDLTPHGGEQGGVSRRHFRLLRQDQGYTIEDLNSTNFTVLDRTPLHPGQPTSISDGAEIRAGRVRLVFRMG